MNRSTLSRFRRRLSAYRIAASLRYRSKRLFEMSVGLFRLVVNRQLSAGLRLSTHLTGEGALTDALRKGLWKVNSSYRSSALPEAGGDPAFQSILARIATGADVSPEELLPYLCLEGRFQRAEVNALLAEAYTQKKTPARLEQARVFVRRAWLLSGGSADLLPLYTRILSALNDTAGLREAYKSLGMQAAAQRDVSKAIDYFDRWQWAYLAVENLDRYEYDFEILNCMDDLAAPHRIVTAPQVKSGNLERIRLVYLLRGILEPNSNLIMISLQFARYHDRSRFDVSFFTLQPERVIELSRPGREHLNMFESLGYNVVAALPLDSTAGRLLALACQIRETKPDIMIATAALADFSQYFMTTLRPAPIVMGLVQGPPQQFAPPVLDWCIAWSKHPLMDCPVNCSRVEMNLDYPRQDVAESYNRKTLHLPSNACILMSAGRHSKFQSREFWQSISDLLDQHPNAYYVAAGPREDQVSFLGSVLKPEVRSRVLFLGWREDFLNILTVADVLIDTYPNGGGQVIVQAMALGIPIVAHRNDYMRLFDQTHWSPVEELIKDPETIVPRGDFGEFKKVISRLIADKDYRGNVGERCRMEHLRSADPSRGVRECEEIYAKVLRRFSEA